MTIASEIEDLQTNLAAAKAAITSRGGTTGDTGLAGLASEILTIPVDWGTVTYLDENDEPETLRIKSEVELRSLCNSSSSSDWNATIDGVQVSSTKIVDVSLGSAAQIIPDYFLSRCPTNFTLTIPNVIELGSSFLKYCDAFNHPLTLPNSLKTIGGSFLSTCTSFNQSITLPDSLTSFGTYFLSTCSSLNKTVTLSNSLTTIGSYFMTACTVFDQPLTIPSTVKTINDHFLNECSSFNQEIILPSSLTTIGANFMTSCTSFNQPLVIPSSVTSFGGSFLYNCNSMVSTVTPNIAASIAPSGNQAFSTTLSSAPCYTTGITIKGEYRSSWMSKYTNRTSSPYRKLIDGGE